jgi:hypothetical protein
MHWNGNTVHGDASIYLMIEFASFCAKGGEGARGTAPCHRKLLRILADMIISY